MKGIEGIHLLHHYKMITSHPPSILLLLTLLLLTSPLSTLSLSSKSHASVQSKSSTTLLRTRPTEPHHVKFYQDVKKELKKLTDPIRIEQPIDSNATVLKDFSNKAILLNRGLNKARLNILKQKEELDLLLKNDLNQLQKNNDESVHESEKKLQDTENKTRVTLEGTKESNKARIMEIQTKSNTLTARKRMLEHLLPTLKASLPKLKMKLRSSKISLSINKRHHQFQFHELTKMERVAVTAAAYASGFANATEEAQAISRDIARTGLAAMRAPAEAARQAEINMMENELVILSDLRSAMAKKEIIFTSDNLMEVINSMHMSLEQSLPSLTAGRTTRLRLFEECTSRGTATLASGKSGCKELLVLHTPELFRKHLNNILEASGSSELMSMQSVSPFVSGGPEQLSENPDATVNQVSKEELMVEAASNARFARSRSNNEQITTDQRKHGSKHGSKHGKAEAEAKAEHDTDMQQPAATQQQPTAQQQQPTPPPAQPPVPPPAQPAAPGSVMEELAKVKEELEGEDPEGEKMAEDEEAKMSALDRAQDMMSKAKVPPTKEIESLELVSK